MPLHLQVVWEPLLEPWSFQVKIIRNRDKSTPLDSGIITDILLKSTTQLNINITKSFCEVSFYFHREDGLLNIFIIYVFLMINLYA